MNVYLFTIRGNEEFTEKLVLGESFAEARATLSSAEEIEEEDMVAIECLGQCIQG